MSLITHRVQVGKKTETLDATAPMLHCLNGVLTVLNDHTGCFSTAVLNPSSSLFSSKLTDDVNITIKVTASSLC